MNKKSNLFLILFLVCLGTLVLAPGIVFAGTKVDVCHIPPGNPENFHTITVSENAVAAHLAHGDLVGACNNVCAALCDDGDACTIDDTGDCETNGCPAEPRDPTDCSDGNLCTDDVCDPANGCSNPVGVTCTPPDLCTSSVCDPSSGLCQETPVSCPSGQECNADTGACEAILCQSDWTCGPGLQICGSGNGTICACDLDTEGNSFCWNNISCGHPGVNACNSNSDCEAGWSCATSCCGKACLPPCVNPDGNAPFTETPIDGPSAASE